ncbi:glycosyltransferase family 4 protein [Patescibacteria group bacterium]|nr:glycosyltransferase family 4 protein [Patescibacteria group bacterium]
MEYKKQLAGLRVAIVHDWLVGLGGGERVVQSLLKLFPQAEIYTSVYDPSKLRIFEGRKIHTTFLQHWPLALKKHQLYSMLRPLAFESLDFSGYDLVISTCSAESKGVITPSETLHIAYLFTPTRYYWSGYRDYIAEPGFGPLNPLARLILKKSIKGLRQWDFAAAQRPDEIVSISSEVSERTKKYYKRPSPVIYPPVDTDQFIGQSSGKDNYYLVLGRLISYKRVDLAVRACTKLGLELVVAGKGPEEPALRKIAGPTVKFIKSPSDQEVRDLYANCKAFIFPGLEDFGITPVEAMAAGKPVICYGKGGATEAVIDGVTGIYHSQQTVASLVEAIQKFEKTSFDEKEIIKRAKLFSEDRFLNELGGYVVGKISKKK